eukprot:49207-Eustigmatos_ZCMA.PRE.1
MTPGMCCRGRIKPWGSTFCCMTPCGGRIWPRPSRHTSVCGSQPTHPHRDFLYVNELYEAYLPCER